jgi:hypothetical protein
LSWLEKLVVDADELTEARLPLPTPLSQAQVTGGVRTESLFESRLPSAS